ncbi:UNVERIFIED_CONTAM: hypothetical protein FKN15_061383 [Acipenser sinensis]
MLAGDWGPNGMPGIGEGGWRAQFNAEINRRACLSTVVRVSDSARALGKKRLPPSKRKKERPLQAIADVKQGDGFHARTAASLRNATLSCDSQFVLVFGDSRVRSLVDGYVQMPEGDLRFGYSSTPGACAAALRKEVLNETLPEEPDLVCLIAPGNNLSKNTIQQAGKEFASLIPSAQGTWNKVVVIDFPNRLTVELPYQDMLRQEYH